MKRPATTTMRAAVLHAARDVRVVEVPTPAPDRRQIRARIEGCGVCISNVALWEGRAWIHYPLTPGAGGHEAWGVVDAVGEDVEGIAPGDRIVALFENGFAEYDVARADTAVKLPDSVRGRFPGEAVGCAVSVFKRSRIEPGMSIAVLGVGLLGSIVCRLATQMGAKVIALSRRPSALALAKSYGVEEAILVDDPATAVARTRERTGGRMCDRVIGAVGQNWPMEFASSFLAENARLVVAGYHLDGASASDLRIDNWKNVDVISAHERDPRHYRDVVAAGIDAVANGSISLEPLLTHVYPLERIHEAFEAQTIRPDGFLKAVVDSI